MQFGRKRHCYASSWTFALGRLIFGHEGSCVVRVIVIVMFDDESVCIDRRRYRVDLLGSSGASSVAFVVHCFDRGHFLQRVLL